MAKSKYVGQQMFNMAAVTAAKAAVITEESIGAIAARFEETLKRTYADVGIGNEIAIAATQTRKFLHDFSSEHLGYECPKDDLIGCLVQMQFCVRRYAPTGKKWPLKIFGGSFFVYERSPLLDKILQCRANVLTYHLLVLNGSIPIVPRGWKL